MTRPTTEQAEYGEVEVRRWAAEDAEELRDVIMGSAERLRPRLPWVDEWFADDYDALGKVAEWNEKWDAGADRHFGVFVEDMIVGAAGLHDRLGPGGLELGYWLADGWTGQGIMTIAAGLLTDLAFADPQIDHLRIIHDVTNLPSAGVPRRLGYTLLGDREATGMRAPDDVGIDCLWELRRADWPGYASLA